MTCNFRWRFVYSAVDGDNNDMSMSDAQSGSRQSEDPKSQAQRYESTWSLWWAALLSVHPI
jgi:hypothetical protein